MTVFELSDARLRLRPLGPADEQSVRTAHQIMAAEDFVFAIDLDSATTWTEYLALLRRIDAGIDLPADRVPATILLAEVGSTIVGRTSVRYELNEWLHLRGGHIGYGVLPAYRRRGHATEILRQSLDLVRARGVADVLVTCDDSNPGSRIVIESCGGVLDQHLPLVDVDAAPVRRYWIPG